MYEQRRGFNWGSLILGILFIGTSLMAFSDPTGNLLTIVLVFAIFAILKGVIEIFVRNRFNKLSSYRSYAPIIRGVIDIFIGIFFLFNLGIGVALLPYVFAIWFLVESILGLFMLEFARTMGNAFYWFYLITDILGIFLGILLLYHPITSVLTLSFLVGFYFMLFGITEIVSAFR
ncbi:DUF308 domain-containing protein [Melissococcus plutonius]|uniref:HdeD family acid-resistance protein n=1 Tax=Melissococcus plutonius TaxID=33970 RepID=UPI003EE7DCE1